MTLFEMQEFSEIKEPGWNYNTLRPPLKFNEILIDFKYQWQSYCQSKLKFHKKFRFLILRFFQRIAYNLGWVFATKQFKKSIRRFLND